MGYCRINLILDLINCVTHYFATYEDTIREIKWKLKHIILQLFVSEGNSLSTRTILEGNSKDSFLFRNSKMKASMELCCHYAIGFLKISLLRLYYSKIF